MHRLVVSWRDERVHFATLVHSDLRDHVGRRAEPVHAESCTRPGHAICAVSNQARAQQWRGVTIVVSIGQRETESGVGDRVFRVATVNLITGVAGATAEMPRQTV